MFICAVSLQWSSPLTNIGLASHIVFAFHYRPPPGRTRLVFNRLSRSASITSVESADVCPKNCPFWSLSIICRGRPPSSFTAIPSQPSRSVTFSLATSVLLSVPTYHLLRWTLIRFLVIVHRFYIGLSRLSTLVINSAPSSSLLTHLRLIWF